jgi:triosephosphate isomerase
MARKLAAGNWKMNGVTASLAQATALAEQLAASKIDVLLCPPATLITPMATALKGSTIATGAQDCHSNVSGAHTGDISAAQLADAGASYVITGHSERRADYSESDEDVRSKTEAACEAGLTAIVCVGETLEQREAGSALKIVHDQLQHSLPDDIDPAKLVIAYEPVWAIGTGKVPTLAEIAEVHADMRATLTVRFGDAANDIPLLYGGSVKPGNAKEIFSVLDVDGALVGGASLKAEDFAQIILALENT